MTDLMVILLIQGTILGTISVCSYLKHKQKMESIENVNTEYLPGYENTLPPPYEFVER